MRKLYLLVAVFAVAIVVVVAFQNTDVVTLNILFWEVSMSRFVLLLLTTASGFLGGFVAASFVRVMPK